MFLESKCSARNVVDSNWIVEALKDPAKVVNCNHLLEIHVDLLVEI